MPHNFIYLSKHPSASSVPRKTTQPRVRVQNVSVKEVSVSVKATGEKLFISLDFRAFSLFLLLPESRREKWEWRKTILPAFLIQHTVKVD